jgi:A/G-specific adenine glycosylase
VKASKKIHLNEACSFREALLAWYDAHARDLPWRHRPGAKTTHDPYRIWISEIMLQQTRVAAVIEHYQEFLRRFPTIKKLAAARESSVLAAWSGLGYYRRARMLHAAAKAIVREFGGKFPATAESLHELPGIGRYTAAAIASIAFDEPVAVVDGNVERVLQRVSGQPLDCEELWTRAEALLDRARPGDFNQAMMELGATVCTPRAPACLTCPVLDLCATRGEMASAAKTVKQRKREIHYALSRMENDLAEVGQKQIRQDSCRDSRPRLSSGPEVPGRSPSGQIFLIQRARNASLMAGMWELPEIPPPNHHAKPILTVRHSITVTDYTVHVWNVLDLDLSAGQWTSIHRLPKLALTGLTRKILRKAGLLTGSNVKPVRPVI